MGKALRKLNFMIEENIYRDLEALVPAGKRSKVANDALRRELELIRRKDAVGKILAARTKGKKLSNKEIVDALVKDRGSH
ncbi:MAG: hypothetical protein PHU49_06890 [Syntrophorhabdaceae bacterium]|nr:hypothetical protein [Syntrophorhabdaceae bacterium]MDD5243727.1 hypothetical protein [Syntrophorhabdaceae bacterium]